MNIEESRKAIRKRIESEISSSPVVRKLYEAYVTVAERFVLPTEQLSERTKAYHQNIYERAIEHLNRVSLLLEGADRMDANSDSSLYRSLKRDEADGINRAFLHGMYFDNISDSRSEIDTSMLCYNRLARDFGGFDNWQMDFVACCRSSRNGWALTVYNYLLNRYINIIVDGESDGVPVGSVPVIVMDMHEHAYSSDYGADLALYVAAMMKEFDWQLINVRFEKSERIASIVQPKIKNTPNGEI